MRNFIFLFLFSVLSCTTSEGATVSYSDYHAAAKKFCKQNKFNQQYYFLIDLSVHSGKNRFYVYDFKKGKITDKNVVTHGSCDQFDANVTKYEKVKFDATVDSHCSMKGKYKVGKRDSSTWGIKVKYWLHGLEASNKNAVERVVVLHSWEKVANKEIFPAYSPLSWGCPAVSDDFMRKLDSKLKMSKKPVLLWIIE